MEKVILVKNSMEELRSIVKGAIGENLEVNIRVLVKADHFRYNFTGEESIVLKERLTEAGFKFKDTPSSFLNEHTVSVELENLDGLHFHYSPDLHLQKKELEEKLQIVNEQIAKNEELPCITI